MLYEWAAGLQSWGWHSCVCGCMCGMIEYVVCGMSCHDDMAPPETPRNFQHSTST